MKVPIEQKFKIDDCIDRFFLDIKIKNNVDVAVDIEDIFNDID